MSKCKTRRNTMKIRNKEQFVMARKAFEKLTGSAVFVDSFSGEKFDLRILQEREAALERLYSDTRESLELFVSNREDNQIMMNLLYDLEHSDKSDFSCALSFEVAS